MALLKLFALVLFLAGYAASQVVPSTPPIEYTLAKQVLDIMIPKILLLEYNNEQTKEGYRFNYVTTDGSTREEVGIIMNPGTDQEELVVMGAFSYTEGDTEFVTMYTADKNGYRPRVEFRKILTVALGVSSKLLQNLSG